MRLLHMPRQKHLAVSVLAIHQLSSDVSRSVGLLIRAISKRAHMRLAVKSSCLGRRVVELLHKRITSIG